MSNLPKAMKLIPVRRMLGQALLLAGVWGGVSASAWAQKVVEGVRFEPRVSVQGQALSLNGAGLRAMMIVRVYAAGLYLPQPASTADAVLATPGPKRVRIVMLRKVSGERLADNLVTGIRDTTRSSAEQTALAARVEALRATMLQLGEARKGDEITLDYVPDAGTRISLGGRVVAADIPGEDFFRALLRIWVSKDAADQGLRHELLGKPA
jgi:hypothetical protein